MLESMLLSVIVVHVMPSQRCQLLALCMSCDHDAADYQHRARHAISWWLLTSMRLAAAGHYLRSLPRRAGGRAWEGCPGQWAMGICAGEAREVESIEV